MKKIQTALFLAAAMVLACGTHATAQQSYTSGQAAAAHFQELDTNKDGKISLQEYQANTEQRFNKADTNRDGFLTQEELQADVAAGKEKVQEALPAAKEKAKTRFQQRGTTPPAGQ